MYRMNHNLKKNRIWKIAIPITFVSLFIFFSCVFLDSIVYEPTATAGEKATFTMKVRLEPLAAVNDDRLVVAFLVPKIWKAAANTKVTYTSSLYTGSIRTMSLIPSGTLPKNAAGLTWEAALRERFGFGPNVLDDMEWLVYWSDDMESVTVRENFTADVKIETKTGPENMNVKLGFFVNHTDDGFSGSADHYKVLYTDCFQVINGEGIIMDFCESHFNMFQPSNVTKDDIATIKFQGGIAPNALDGEEEVYMCATAYTNTGNAYEVVDRSEKSKMIKDSHNGKTFSLTLWLGDYFKIPQDESISRIEYYFTNKDGSKAVKEVATDGTVSLFITPCICK